MFLTINRYKFRVVNVWEEVNSNTAVLRPMFNMDSITYREDRKTVFKAIIQNRGENRALIDELLSSGMPLDFGPFEGVHDSINWGVIVDVFESSEGIEITYLSDNPFETTLFKRS